MKKTTSKSSLAAMAMAILTAYASVTWGDVLTATATITESGQTFVFSFDSVGVSDGTAGTLLVEALGDYSATPPSLEILDIDIDGFFVDFAFDPTRGAIIGTDLFQNAASQSYMVSEADLSLITSDGSVMMTLQNSSTVDFFPDQPDDFVRATLTYSAVPEPATGGWLLLGLGWIVSRRICSGFRLSITQRHDMTG